MLNLHRKWRLCLACWLAGMAFFANGTNAAVPELAERAGTMRLWRVADGLPSDLVTAVLQTRDGFLWVGTATGLVRFDGVKFTGLKLTGSADHPVSVTALCEDSQGDLWVGTQDQGLFELEHGTFRHFTVGQGLLDNRVTSLAAGSQGVVWIGSPAGLNLWGGGRFKSFTARDGLPDKFVSGVNVAPSGTVWITTRVGMCRFIGGKLVPYTFQTESQGRSPEYLGVYEDRSGNLWAFGDTYLINLSENKRLNYFRSSQSASVRIWSLCEGRDGRLWIGTSGGGLFCFEDNRFRPVILGESRQPYDVRAICEDQEGNLWLGTSGGGLMQLRPESVHIMQAGQGLPASAPTALALDARGRLYVGSEHGGLFMGQSGRFDRLDSGDGWEAENLISSVCVGRDGTVWAGTLGDGIFGIRGERSIHLTTADGLADDTVLAVCVDAAGGLWASTSAGTVHCFSDFELPISDLGNDNSQPAFGDWQLPASVTAMIPCSSGGLWLGTQDGQILRESNGIFSVMEAASQSQETHSVAFFHPLTQNTAFDLSDKKETSFFHPATALQSKRNSGQKGNLLLPNNSAVLSLYEGKRDGVFAARSSPERRGSNGQNGQNLLWIGTDGGGLSCLAGGTAMNWNTNRGLPSDIVAGVTEDGAGNLWLATGAGIYRVNRADVRKAIEHAGSALECQWISDAKTVPESGTAQVGTRVALAPDGELWFATSQGVMSVDARQSGVEPVSFPVYIESAEFNGQPPVSLLRGPLWSRDGPGASRAESRGLRGAVDSQPSIVGSRSFRAPVEVRSLEIHFTALNFTAPDEIQFRHKLEGFDADWVDDGATRSARYGRLPYGHYRFRLAVRDPDGNWREAAQSFSFVVPTPLYIQTWAIGLYVLTAVALIAGVVRMVSHRRLRAALARLEQQQSLERERMRIARDMHDEMGSKLTKISFLSERAQMDALAAGPNADKIQAIAQTSRELLKTMDEIVWVVNPRNDTLENLAAYLSSYAVEYFQNTRVECELSLPRQIPHYPLSSETRHNLFLAFEEALNNVLKHSAATKVRIEITVSPCEVKGAKPPGDGSETTPSGKPLEFELKVTDNGCGFETSGLADSQRRVGPGGNGLKNMRQRLAAAGGNCQVFSKPGVGTTIALRMRLNEGEAGLFSSGNGAKRQRHSGRKGNAFLHSVSRHRQKGNPS